MRKAALNERTVESEDLGRRDAFPDVAFGEWFVRLRKLPEPLGVVGRAVELRGGFVEFEGSVAGDGFGLG